MFDRLIHYISNLLNTRISECFKAAFSVYLVSSLLSVICGILAMVYILDIGIHMALKDIILEYLFLCLILTIFSLNLESILYAKLPAISLRFIVCIILILVAIPIFVYIILPFFDGSKIQEREAFYKYISLFIAFGIVFMVIHLKDDFKHFLYFVVIFCFIILFVIVYMVLFGILFLSIAILFEPHYSMLDIFSVSMVLCGVLVFLFFIGRIHNLDNAPYQTNLRYFFMILNIFACVYLLLLLLYFLSLGFGLLPSNYGIMHLHYLIIYFCSFSLVLVWANKGRQINQQINQYNNLLLVSIIILMLVGLYFIISRILTYGVTPNRYFVVLICLYLLVSAICSLLFKNYLKYLLLLLAFICVISAFGLANTLSVKSQLNQLKKLELNESNYQRISSIYNFLHNYSTNINGLDKYRDFLALNPILDDRFSYIFTLDSINIKDFDRLFFVRFSSQKIDNYQFVFDDNYSIFKIYKNDKLIAQVDDFWDILQGIDNKIKGSNIVTIKANNMLLRFYFTNISGLKRMKKIFNLDFYLLVGG